MKFIANKQDVVSGYQNSSKTTISWMKRYIEVDTRLYEKPRLSLASSRIGTPSVKLHFSHIRKGLNPWMGA